MSSSLVFSRRVLVAIEVACLALSMSACAAFGRGSNRGPTAYPLTVINRSDFEVIVSAVTSSTGSTVRIGNARSFATTTMSVPRNALQATDILVVNVRSIGSGRLVPSWTSPGVSLDTTVVAQLDIRADANGNLSRSILTADYPAGYRPPINLDRGR